ncbi:MAG: sigma 54-interacting transcriptional regulator [Pseudomonadota bacterium]
MGDQTTRTGASFSGRGTRSSRLAKVLILAHGPDPERLGEVGVLGRVAAVIGRDPAAGLFPGGPVDDGLLSRRHAEVTPGKGGEHRVRDLGSRNGTFVNGVAVRGEDEWVLRPGDVVRAGGVFMVYREIPEDLLDLLPDPDSSLGGLSVPIRRVQQQLRLLARVDLPVLLLGESGTGKELAAQDLHALGDRRDGAFVAVNCAAIPKDLFEATLFGHERGAFTGATERHPGLFEEADGGTLFLDEIGELPMGVQAKLLRVLEDGAVLRVGGTRPQQVSVRVVAATRANLSALVREASFRDDLYARIAQAVIELPPLRDRIEDLPMLVRRFLDRGDAAAPLLSEELVEELLLHPWRLNVRELRSLVELLPLDHPDHLGRVPMRLGAITRARMDNYEGLQEPGDREAMDAARLQGLLSKHRGNISRVATSLGVHRYQVYRWMERFGIARE